MVSFLIDVIFRSQDGGIPVNGCPCPAVDIVVGVAVVGGDVAGGRESSRGAHGYNGGENDLGK